MTKRQEEILQILIKEYVKRAEPISSGFLAGKCGFECSPATLRAEMMELENSGYLQQPHTSAGRIPTDKAYRFFVDKLLKDPPAGGGKENALPEKDRRTIDRTIEESPQRANALSAGLARAISNLTDDFAISGIADTNEFYKMGFSNILESPEREDFFGFGSIFDEFENYFERFFSLSERPPEGRCQPQQLVVYIGRENPERGAHKEAVIVARYPLPEGYEGISAVIGPMRMAYDRNLALLKYITKKMNELN